MAQVISFEDFTPIPRYDATPWTDARIEESDTSTLSDTTVWTELETIPLSPVDADPSDPASRDFTTELASDDLELWYRIIFVDGNGDESIPTAPIQNTDPDETTAYASVDELFRILKIGSPTDAQVDAAERVLIAAAGEINSYIDLADDADALTGWQIMLATQVNLERAAELWKLQEIQFGIVELAGDFGATRIARDTFLKHAITLGPLKGQQGFA
jgi:hypothetical protein